MRNIYILLLAFVCGVMQATKPIIGFIENKGQIHDQNFKPNTEVKYLLSIPGMNIQLKQNSFSYDTYTLEQKNTEATRETALTKLKHPKLESTYHFHRVDVEFIGANTQPEIIAEHPSETYYNYYTTGTCEQGATNVRSYEKVTYKNIYPNIDLEFIAKEGKLKYNFIVHYGGDMNVIKWKYHGANTSEIKNNNISIAVKQGEFTEVIPESYIENHFKRNEVKINFNKENGTFGFLSDKKVNIYKDEILVIDPTLTLLWATYYGGTGLERLWSSCVDNFGNTYYTGFTASTSAIATVGSYQTSYGGGSFDVAILKFDPSGNRIWSSYFGGTGDDEGYGISIDKLSNIYVTGFTSSSSSIASIGSHQSTYGGGPYDGFLFKMSNTGALLWSTYYGGSGDDQGYLCQIDTVGNVIVSGQTSSTNSISTLGTQQTTYAGGSYDAFLAKFNSNGVRQWGTYYGGSGEDVGLGCSVDTKNNIYLTGYTTSSVSIATTGSHQFGYGGNKDCFLTRFNSNGIRKWATYYGGSGNDLAMPVATDSLDYIYIAGVTNSLDSISTSSAHQSIYGGCATTTGCNGDGFLVKFDSIGIRQWGTYYGGTRDDGCYDVFTKGTNVFICGTSMSQTGISTPNTYQDFNVNQYVDILLAKFNNNGVRQWGTYMGSFLGDFAYSVIVDNQGYIYLCGESDGSFPVTASAYQTNVGGSIDGVIVKFRESATVSNIDNLTIETSLLIIYPNPNSGSFSIQTKEDVVLEVVNELGQLIKTVKLDAGNNHQATITGLADGVYCLKDKLSGTIIKNKIVVVR